MSDSNIEIEKTSYIEWDNNKINGKQKSSSLQSRYFSLKSSIENSKDKFVESDEFKKRKENLLKRIFSTRGTSENAVATSEETISLKKTIETRKSGSVADFIPIESSSSSSSDDDDYPKNNASNGYNPSEKCHDSYNGSYNKASIERVRRVLIEELSNKINTNRKYEILKIKLKIPSKFDGDERLLKKLKRINSQKIDYLNDRQRHAKRTSQNGIHPENVSQKTHKHFEDEDDDIIELVNGVEVTSQDTLPKYISDYDDDSSVNDNKEITTDFIFNDEDSKCKQLSKYSKNYHSDENNIYIQEDKLKETKKNKNKKPTMKSLRLQIENLEAEYRLVRDEKNRQKKLERKTKKRTQEEIELSKEETKKLINKLKEMRKKLKKLKIERKSFSKKNKKQNNSIK